MNVGSTSYSVGRGLYGGLSDKSWRSNIPEEVLRDLNKMQRDSKNYSPEQAFAIAAYVSQFRKSPFFNELLTFVGNEIIPHKSVRAANFTDCRRCRSKPCICRPSHAGEIPIEDLCNEEGSSVPALRRNKLRSAPFNGYVPPRDEHDFKVDLEVL
ncbi:MAG: hypothetical protein AABX12_05360 [Nanoarchaeota archaeon]